MFYGYFKGWICEAREDGSIPLNSKALFKVLEPSPDELTAVLALIAQANRAAKSGD